MDLEINISLKSISKSGETYMVSSLTPLTAQQITETCWRKESDMVLVTDCGNNRYLCDVYRGGESCDISA